MKWKKLGRIFDPASVRLPFGCTEFAQSPQALVCDTHVRIYFSTRVRESDGNYLSHIAYADMTPDCSRLLDVSSHAVIALGRAGCFDEHGIFPMNVLRVGGQVYGYTSGVSRRVSVPVDTAIGLAISDDDGRTFTRIGEGPILAPSLHEPCLVADPFVMRVGDDFHMWYIFGTGWISSGGEVAPERIYRIGHASSKDGVDWLRNDGRSIIGDVLGTEECQALPTVIEIGGRYHMYFCYRHARDFRTDSTRAYRIGHAWSDDLLNWFRDDRAMNLSASSEGWDSEMVCYPHVFRHDGRVWMLYNGNAFGRAGFGLAVLE